MPEQFKTVAENRNAGFAAMNQNWVADANGINNCGTQVLTQTVPLPTPVLAQLAHFANEAHRLAIDSHKVLPPQIFLALDKSEIGIASNQVTVMTIEVKRPEDGKIVRFHVSLAVPMDGDDVYCAVYAPDRQSNPSSTIKGSWIDYQTKQEKV
jgi:hypothetical protein